MEFRFHDINLQRVFEEEGFRGDLSVAMVKAFRKRMQQIIAAVDERLFYAIGGMSFEKLKDDREGQFSMRLNDQYRLILEFEGENPKTAVIVEIVDYH